MPARPVTRVTFVLPEDAGALDTLIECLASELAPLGVQTARHVMGAAPETAFRADVALWWPGPDGRIVVPSPREVPARVHVLVLDDEPADVLAVSGYDAVVVVHEVLVAPVKARLSVVGQGAMPVVARALPLAALHPRDAAQARRGVRAPVVLVDLRRGFERDVERVLIQLALVTAPHTRVLLVPHGDRPRARARELAQRHAVDAHLTSGPEAFGAAIPAVDLLVGRPQGSEVLLAAAHRVATSWLEGDGEALPALVEPLLRHRLLSSADGVLKLGATLERRLADRGGLDVEGTLLKDALVGDPTAFLAELGRVKEHIPAARGQAVWEPIGPHADASVVVRPVVDARAPITEVERAARIEDALSRLKARLAAGEGEA